MRCDIDGIYIFLGKFIVNFSKIYCVVVFFSKKYLMYRKKTPNKASSRRTYEVLKRKTNQPIWGCKWHFKNLNETVCMHLFKHTELLLVRFNIYFFRYGTRRTCVQTCRFIFICHIKQYKDLNIMENAAIKHFNVASLSILSMSASFSTNCFYSEPFV